MSLLFRRNDLVTNEKTDSTAGNSYTWTPSQDVPVDDNALKIIDLDDQTVNYSLQFTIKGANATWVASENPYTDGVDSGAQNPGDTSPPSSGGLSTALKVTIGVVTPVAVFVIGTCIGLWLRNKRDNARRGNHPLRTMSTDNSPTSYNSEYKDHLRPVRQELHSDSSKGFTPIKKLVFSEKEVGATENEVSLPAWDDDFLTPSNNKQTSSPYGEDEIHPSVEGGYMSSYGRPKNQPESPTPKPRAVSAPVQMRQSPPPLATQHWELPAGIPVQPRAELAQQQPHHDLPHNKRNVSSPLPTSSSSSMHTERNDRDLYAGVTFGDSDDPDEIVAHLTAQRQRVRAEKERLRKLQELSTTEEEIDRQIEAARQKRA